MLSSLCLQCQATCRTRSKTLNPLRWGPIAPSLEHPDPFIKESGEQSPRQDVRVQVPICEFIHLLSPARLPR
jgi:hypothetical protein